METLASSCGLRNELLLTTVLPVTLPPLELWSLKRFLKKSA